MMWQDPLLAVFLVAMALDLALGTGFYVYWIRRGDRAAARGVLAIKVLVACCAAGVILALELARLP